MKLFLKRFGYYVLSFTWGGLMSIIGFLVILFSCFFGRVHTYHGRLYAIWGGEWGGLELGCFFIVGRNCDELRAHESGHGLQNIIWGPLYVFVIGIPSVIRYWYRELKYYKKGLVPPTDYDAIWFEGQATRWGEKYVETDII